MGKKVDKFVTFVRQNKNVDAYKQLDKVLKEKCSERVKKLLKNQNNKK